MDKDRAVSLGRISYAPLLSAPVWEPNQVDTYFKVLSNDVIVTILRLTDGNSDPYVIFYMCKICSSDQFVIETRRRALLFFSSRSPFRLISRTMFTEIRIVDGYMIRLRAREGIMQLGTGSLVAQNVFVFQIIRACAEFIKKVKMDCMKKRDSNYYEAVNFVIANCRNVDQLTLIVNYSAPQIPKSCQELLNCYGSRLRSFTWGALPSPGIPDLTNCTMLKSFSYKGDLSNKLLSLIPIIGGKLEYLQVVSDEEYGWNNLLMSIQDNCHSITCIILPGPLVVADVGAYAYKTFLTSFGDRLENASLYALKFQDVSDVVSACRNLKIEIRSPKYIHQWSLICELTLVRLKSLTVRIGFDVATNFEYIENAMAKTRNLTKLTVFGVNTPPYIPNTMMQSLFSSSLDVTHLYLYGVDATVQNMQLIATRTSKLKRLDIMMDGAFDSGHMLHFIARANPYLETVIVQDPRRGQPPRTEANCVDIIHEIVESFWKCRRLSYLKITLNAKLTRRAIIDVNHAPLLNRGVRHSIHFCSIDY